MGINHVKKLEFFKRLLANSPEVPGKEIDLLCETAKKNEIMVVGGINERAGYTVYNSQIFINKSRILSGPRPYQ